MQANPRISKLVSPVHRHAGFTLIELLTVIFIIGILIGILIPALGGARIAAKNAATASTLNSALKTGLEMFRTENETEYVNTNGYPPSFAHPSIGSFQFQPHIGECPYLAEKPQLYGAQWLPLMLTGPDGQGLVQRSTVRAYPALVNNPPAWYGPNPANSNPPKILPRAQMYIDPSKIRSSKLNDLPGIANRSLFPDWNDGDSTPNVIDSAQEFPVLLDSYDQPILYYAANKYGTTSNMVEDVHSQSNSYQGQGGQQSGQPYYFHQDNIGFTGTEVGNQGGWDFGAGRHAIEKSGHELTSVSILTPENMETFARYILDAGGGELGNAFGGDPVGPLRPVNADTYLLLSAGADGRFGTKDDVTNFRKR